MNDLWGMPLRAIQRRGYGFGFGALVVLLAALLVIAGQPAQTQSKAPKEEPNLSQWKLPETVQAATAASGDRDRLVALSGTMAQAGPTIYCIYSVEFTDTASRERLNVRGITVYTAFKQFADMFVPTVEEKNGRFCDSQALKAVRGAPGYVADQKVGFAEVAPPPEMGKGPRTRGPAPEEIVRGGIGPLRGQGVIIAVLDTGLDFRNPDFITYDRDGRPTSRLLYFWDTFSDAYETQGLGSKAPYAYPNGRSIGTLYTREQLTAELRSTTKRIPTPDEHGHGTAAAGVAAGNGNNAKGKGSAYLGVAPEADLIGVRVGGLNGLGSMQNGYLLNAVAGWLDREARRGGKPAPVVMSCSYGGQSGAHDGSTVQERQLDARFADSVQGRAIVISAGNEQSDPFHSKKRISDRKNAALLVWFARENAGLELFVRNADGTPFDGRNLVLEGGRTGDGKPLDLSSRWEGTDRITRDHIVAMDPPRGLSGVFLWSRAGTEAIVDAYIYGGAFPMVQQSPENTVGKPGTAKQAITVGSYQWNDQFDYAGQIVTLTNTCGSLMQIGAISCYSSVGYSRAPGVVKPDIVSPGEWYPASYAKLADGTGIVPKDEKGQPMYIWNVDTSGNYILFNGTSAAAPYTAGVVALMFQKKPTLTVGEIKGLLHKYASLDAFTTSTKPNPAWGYGKLDLKAVRAILGAL